MKADLVVIGSGPAGMSAAITAAEYGATVTIVDENPIAGGKLLGQLYEDPNNGWWIGKNVAQALKEKVNRLGITCLQETEVWGISPHWKVQLNTGHEIEATNIVIASGAAEKPVPIPGWTTPGVMAIGAAQVLTNYHRVKPGKKVAIVGVDPLSLTVAHELKMAGVDVIGIFLPPSDEFSLHRSHPKQMISYLSSMSQLAPTKPLKLAGKLAKNRLIQNIGAALYPRNGLKVWGIPLFLRKTVVAIEGNEQVENIKVTHVDSNGMPDRKNVKAIEVDTVCLSGGLSPLAELAGAVRCGFAHIEELGGHVPLHGPEMETTQQGIFVAGNITGIESAQVAMAQGELAGTSISARLGLLHDEADTHIKNAQNQVKKAREKSAITFQPNVECGREKLNRMWHENLATFR